MGAQRSSKAAKYVFLNLVCCLLYWIFFFKSCAQALCLKENLKTHTLLEAIRMMNTGKSDFGLEDQLPKHGECCWANLSCGKNHVCIRSTCFCPSNCTYMVGKKFCDCSSLWDKETLEKFKGILKKINPVPPYLNWCSSNIFECFLISAVVAYFASAFICLGVKSYIIHREKRLRQQRSELSLRVRRMRAAGVRGASPARSISDDGSLDRMIPLPVSENRPSFLQRLEYGRPVIRLQGYVIDNGTVVQNAPFNSSLLTSMQIPSAPPVVDSPCMTDEDGPPDYSEISSMSRPPSFSPPPPYDECVLNTSI